MSGSDECLRITGHDSYVLSEQTEIVVSENGAGTTQFCGSTFGIGDDNPNTADSLTEQQKNRAITLSFSDKACITLRYSISCCTETGRNFLMGGSSRAMLPTCGDIGPSATPVALLPEVEELVNTIEESLAAENNETMRGPYRICSSGHACWRPDCAEIDLTQAVVRYSNLGGHGPDVGSPAALRLGNVATSNNGRVLDILVTSRTAYTPTNPSLNKINAQGFASINVAAGTSVALTLSFVDAFDEPVERIELPCVTLSFFDLHNGAFSSQVLKVGSFDTYTVADGSELFVHGYGSGETHFASTTRGENLPTVPTDLSEQQRQRTVALRFSDVSSIDFSFEVPDSSAGGGKPRAPHSPPPAPSAHPPARPRPSTDPLTVGPPSLQGHSARTSCSRAILSGCPAACRRPPRRPLCRRRLRWRRCASLVRRPRQA